MRFFTFSYGEFASRGRIPIMIAPSSDSALLDRLLEPLAQSLSPEAARQLLSFRADEQTQSLIDSLARKANEGVLSEAEQNQYESLVRYGTLIATLQAKARKVVAQHTGD